MALRSMNMLISSRHHRVIARWLILALVLVILALMFVPWVQTVTGKGSVTVFSPMERPQTIEAQLSGRLIRWHVKEGDAVKAGQLLAELEDIDPKFLAVEQLAFLKTQKQALEARRHAAIMRLRSLSTQQSSVGNAQDAALPAARQKVSQNVQKLEAARQAVEAARQNVQTAQLNYDRVRHLFDQGLRSKRDFELVELDKVRAETDLRRAEANFDVANQDIRVAEFDQDKVLGDTEASIASVGASMASAQETIATVNSDLAKLAVDIDTLERRIKLRNITSPVDGRVVRLISLGESKTIMEGDVLATVVPDTQDQAVELFVSDWDAPLLAIGRPVRLQFSGWPAIQFAGWPMIAVGTFGGRIAVIDAVDDGMGRYRVLVKPDRDAIAKGEDDPWPSPYLLRPGSEALGWIMLNEVPLGFELWRQFNAFPPTVTPADAEKAQSNADKAEKAPKRAKAK